MTLEGLLAGGVVEAARGILGRRLDTRIAGRPTAVVLTEVEAYGGGDDPASHAHRGPSRRNRSMFGPPGTLYVYRSYGIHWCMNVVVGPEGSPGAVLLRAGVPMAGVEFMAARRGRPDHLTDGPGKLAQALGVSGELDGSTVTGGPVLLGEVVSTGPIVAGPRVGIRRAATRPWRFVLDL